MRLALREAAKAASTDEVPVGAIVVFADRVVGRGRNRVESRRDATGHAEIQALQLASRRLKRWRLTGCTVYSTLEPCAMCAGAMIHYRVGRAVYGERDLHLGAAGSVFNILNGSAVQVTGGVLRAECRRPLLAFFEKQLGRPGTSWEDIRIPC